MQSNRTGDVQSELTEVGRVMQSGIRARVKDAKGFTLIELIVVLAILGILTAILIPQFMGIFDQGDETSYNTDVAAVSAAVSQFKLAQHDGPDCTTTCEWGAGQGHQRIYPTEDGLVGDIELSQSATEADDGNRRVHKYVQGLGIGATATDDDITHSLLWLGLLVNEPANASGASQQATGDASPQDGEGGQYLPEFPDSANAANTKKTGDASSYTDGTYFYVLLHDGQVAAVYKKDGNYYAGFASAYP